MKLLDAPVIDYVGWEFFFQIFLPKDVGRRAKKRIDDELQQRDIIQRKWLLGPICLYDLGQKVGETCQRGSLNRRVDQGGAHLGKEIWSDRRRAEGVSETVVKDLVDRTL